MRQLRRNNKENQKIKRQAAFEGQQALYDLHHPRSRPVSLKDFYSQNHRE